MDLFRSLSRVCREDTHVSAAHLASRCAYGSADCRLRFAGKSAAEDGHLWLSAVLASLAAESVHADLDRTTDGRALVDRNYLRRVSMSDSARLETAGRLFLRQPYGLLHVRYFCPEREGVDRQRDPAGEPWHHHRPAVSASGVHLRAPAYARDFRIRRRCASDAVLCNSICDHGVRLRGTAAAEWVHRRIHDSFRRLPSEFVVGRCGSNRADSGGRLFTVVVPAHDARSAEARGKQELARSISKRAFAGSAAGFSRIRNWHLSPAVVCRFGKAGAKHPYAAGA